MLKVKHLLILQAFALFATFLLTTNASAVEFDLDTLPTGQFEVNMYPPVTYDEWMIMNEAIDEQAPGWGITSGGTEYCENASSCMQYLLHARSATELQGRVGGLDYVEFLWSARYGRLPEPQYFPRYGAARCIVLARL